MYRLKFRITARSPLIISTISGDMNMVNTEKFIPGTTVLGVLASRFIERQKGELEGRSVHENDVFYNWFLSGDLKMSNAYILSRDEYGEHAHYPTPLSIEREKYGQTVYDRLRLEQEPPEPTKHLGDFCLLDEASIQTQSVKTVVNFHHERDREKGRPRMIGETGVIFNYESIAPGQIFEGGVLGEASDLKHLLQLCGNRWTAFVGRSRNAQYGAAEFEFFDKEPVPVQNQVAWPEDEDGQPAETISMTLLSDLILYNEHGYPTTDVDDLQAELERQVGEVAIEKAFVRENEVENFVGVWRLKKPSEVCFAAGSTFLLKIDPDYFEPLVKIQQNGIGERTHEGFGRCIFGLQTQPELSLLGEAKETVKKPDGNIPNIAKRVMTEIVQGAIAERLEMDAINQMRAFDRLPSNTLIARLHTMAQNAENHSQFVADINKLRKLASDQLQRCVSRESNLLEFLGKNPLDWSGFFRDQRNTQLKSLCEEINLNPEADEALNQELRRRYFTTFLSMMRKRAIAEQEGDDG